MIMAAPPRGWIIERTSGTRKWRKMAKGGVLLRVQEVGIKPGVKYSAYHGAKYLGAFATFEQAVRIAEEGYVPN